MYIEPTTFFAAVRQKYIAITSIRQKKCRARHEVSANLLIIKYKTVFWPVLLGLLCHPFTAASAVESGNGSPSRALDYLWWEAENYSASSGTIEQTHQSLSAERWIQLDETEDGHPRYLEYNDIEVPASGTYHLYTRKFWRHGPFEWSVDGKMQGRIISANTALIDTVTLDTNLVANWTYAGQVNLEEGKHHLRIELLAPRGAAAFDAFVLTSSPFPFRGKYKPEDQIQLDEPGWFPWKNSLHGSMDNPIDLSYLNQDVAGEQGFIIPKGENFAFQDTGEIVRFWGVNAGREVVGMDALSADLYARDLARHGVNLVRIHTPLFSRSSSSFETLDEHLLDRLFYLIAALKQEGIYVSLSIFFPRWVELGPNDPRFPGYDGTNPFGALFFHPALQEIYRGWWEQLLTQPNPYTGFALKDEKAIFSLELVNEDSLLFWTFSERTIPREAMQILESAFASWLIENFGSLEQTAQRWRGIWGLLTGGFDKTLDHPEEQRIGFIPIYDISQGKNQRARDTARFLAETQTKFFRQHQDFLKNEIGFQGMVSASNWITANDRTLGPLDKSSNTVGDFMDHHGYFQPVHQDDGDSTSRYSLREGHRYQDLSALTFPARKPGVETDFSNPIWNIVYNNKPSVISEINWSMPNRYRADMPFLFAGFARLQGVDAVIQFASQPSPWTLQHSKFSIDSPVIKGQWPAAALAFRKGYVQEGPVVAEADLPLADYLYDLRGSPLAVESNPDSLWDSFLGQQKPEAINPLHLFTGKAKVNFRETGSFREIYQNTENLLEGKSILSATRQLMWDYGTGFSTINAAKVQGATGFLSRAGQISLKHMQIDSPMEYGSIWLIALDDMPLDRSEKMLLLVISEDKNASWKTESNGALKTIIDLGTQPILVKEVAGEIRMLRPDAADLKVTTLDQVGNPLMTHGNAQSIQLEPTTTYYLIEEQDL